MEFVLNPMKEINIKTTANGGYLVHVGCTHFAYTDLEKLITDLSEYMRDPEAVEKEFNRHHKYEDDRPAPRNLGRFMPESETGTTGQAEAPDPAENIESSGY